MSSCRRREAGSLHSCASSSQTSRCASDSRGRSHRTRLRLRATESSTVTRRCLPRYRGPSPVSWAIRNGESEIGFTFHYMDAELDTGNILAQERIPLGDEHGWEELTPKLATAVGNILPGVLERVASGDAGDPQDESAASYFGLFEPEYAWIDSVADRGRGRAAGSRMALPLRSCRRPWRPGGDRRRDGARPPRQPRAC